MTHGPAISPSAPAPITTSPTATACIRQVYLSVNGIISMMASRPTVSVITPAYNVAPYIGQCIESLQAQTLSDWEMLIVDDASADETPAVVQGYLHDPRIRYMRNEQNLGPGATRNRALD
ncbi:hypothetical protein CEN46_17850, partial [Fischerella thermalis CCMEE 5318]